jgi:hypothetical protein
MTQVIWLDKKRAEARLFLQLLQLGFNPQHVLMKHSTTSILYLF